MAASRILRPMRNIASTTARLPAITPSHTPISQRILPTCRNATLRSQQRTLATAADNTPIPQNFRVPSLGAYDSEFLKGGIPGLLSPKAYSIAWVQYQGHLAQKLANLTAGEPLQQLTPKDIAVQYARDPNNASLFNYASMLTNNHIFIKGLSTSPRTLDRYPGLQKSLLEAFGSIDSLKASMIESAMGMFGPGFTWLVYNLGPPGTRQTSPGRRSTESRELGWRILNTYNAGTPFGEAGNRRQEMDMATNSVGSMGAHSAGGRLDAQVPPGSTRLLPVLCVNTWEHVWLEDYKVWGKRQYLESWWNAIDWSVVDSNMVARDETRHIGQSNTTRQRLENDRQKQEMQIERQGRGFHDQ